MEIKQPEKSVQRPAARGYFFKTPWWMKALFPKRVWHFSRKEKVIYLSFDDGPHPVATPFVLDTLKSYNAKASFFCIGKNVQEHPDLYQRILNEGHRTGNHTQHHLNGWKTETPAYMADIESAAELIHSRLFRPPYGRMKGSQARKLKGWQIIMWDVLSGDFDTELSPGDCLTAVLSKTSAGSIIVFHDSEKAFERMAFVLPVVLERFTKLGYRFAAIEGK